MNALSPTPITAAPSRLDKVEQAAKALPLTQQVELIGRLCDSAAFGAFDYQTMLKIERLVTVMAQEAVSFAQAEDDALHGSNDPFFLPMLDLTVRQIGDETYRVQA